MGAHEWGSWVGDFAGRLEASRGKEDSTHPLSNDAPHDSNTTDPLESTSTEPIDDSWSWEPPDLGPGSPFYHEQIALLRAITEEHGKPSEWISDRQIALASHHENYGPDGPKQVVILSWNWPPEHWVELREGASMNFLTEPPPGLVTNSEMTEQKLETAAQFVGKLIALGILKKPLEPLLSSFSLFLVEKVIQEQWRCIADENNLQLGPCAPWGTRWHPPFPLHRRFLSRH
jgi:hypothetical protein